MRQNTNEPHSGRNCGFGELFCQGAQRHLRQRPADERHGGIESRIRRYAPCVPRPRRTRALIAVHREHRDQHHFRNRDVPSRQCVVLGVACHFRSLVVGRPCAVGSTLGLLEPNSIHEPSRTALIRFSHRGKHMKPLALVAALALALMVAGCMHEQPQLGGATAGAGFVPHSRLVDA